MLWLIVLIPISIYLFLVLLLVLFQDKFVFLPGKTIFMTPDEKGMDYEELWIEVPDGSKINGWFIKAKEPKATLLFCHGNAGTISHRIESAEIFLDLGLNVLLYDYRGYGRSPRSPSEKNSYEDSEAVWNYLTEEKKLGADEIIILGRSMGGPIAANLAKNHSPKMCILESTFTSIPDVARYRFPIFPTKGLVNIKYPTVDYVKGIKCPLLLVHSQDDEIIPYWMGEKIFAAANEPKEFLELSAGHNETYFECIDKYRDKLEDCIRKFVL